VPAPVTDELAHESPLNDAGIDVPFPLRPITVTAPFEELLLIVNWPADAPAVAGSNCTFSVIV